MYLLVVGAVCFSLVAALLVALASVDQHLGSRLILWSLALTTAALVVCAALLGTAVRSGIVRYAASGPLRFLPRRRAAIAEWVMAAALLLPGATTLIALVLDLPISNMRGIVWGPVALVIASIVEFVRLIVSRRAPAGLTVDEAGIRGVRGAKPLDMPWEEIMAVQAFTTRGNRFSVWQAGGLPVTIGAAHLGSDAACVAAVVRYFLERPEYRPALADPAVALNTVERDLRVV